MPFQMLVSCERLTAISAENHLELVFDKYRWEEQCSKMFSPVAYNWAIVQEGSRRECFQTAPVKDQH